MMRRVTRYCGLRTYDSAPMIAWGVVQQWVRGVTSSGRGVLRAFLAILDQSTSRTEKQ